MKYRITRDTRCLRFHTELLLKSPLIQRRTALAKMARDALIRQLWHCGRLLALMRDKRKYAAELDRLNNARTAVKDTMRGLRTAEGCGK